MKDLVKVLKGRHLLESKLTLLRSQAATDGSNPALKAGLLTLDCEAVRRTLVVSHWECRAET
jgi:hypothetical protein